MAKAPATPRAEKRFVVVWSTFAIVLLVLGFTPSWFLRPVTPEPPGGSMTPFVALHGALFTAWLLYYCTQLWLAACGRIAQHMALGRWAPGFIVILFATGIGIAFYGAARGDPEAVIPPDVFLLLPLCEAIGFAVLSLWAWRKRSEPHVHKRLMMFSIAVILGTGTGRLLGGLVGTFIVPLPFILSIWLFDWIKTRRIDRQVVAGGLLALACYAIPLAFGFTEGWRAIAGGMIEGWRAAFG